MERSVESKTCDTHFESFKYYRLSPYFSSLKFSAKNHSSVRQFVLKVSYIKKFYFAIQKSEMYFLSYHDQDCTPL